MSRHLYLPLLVVSIIIGAPGLARAEEPTRDRLLGVGYKIGNGIGFVGGDVIINPIPHLSIDLHFAMPPSGYSGIALAPAIQGHLFAGGRSTPYLGIGIQYVRLRQELVTASGTGFFANLGYEWKWDFGLGVQLGAGVQYLGEITATGPGISIQRPGGVSPNLELGIRYMFL